MYEENYKPEEVDMRTHALKVFSQKPEAILINPNSPETGLNFLKEVKRLGFKGKIYGNFFGSGEEVIKLPDAQGMIFFADPVVKEGSKKDKLFKEYIKRYGSAPDFEFAVAAQYDAVYILKQAIEEVGYNPEAIKDYLHQLKDFNGVLGTYGFNDKGDAEGLTPAVKQIKDYKVVDYKD